MHTHIVTSAAAVAVTAAAATGASPTNEDLTARVAELEREIASMRAGDAGHDWLTEQRADEIRGLVEEVLADADTRSSLLQSGMSAGYDKGFFIGSGDGAFSLKMNGQIQVRYVYNHQDAPTVIPGKNDGDESRGGFELRRVQLKFKGNVIDDSWGYQVNGAFDRASGTFGLDEGVISKKFDNGWMARMGQFKAPFMREELASSSRQLTVERSLVNERFNQDRTQGIELSYEQDQFHMAVMYHEGFGVKNSPWSGEDTEFAFAGRAEMLLQGEWGQFKDFSGWPGGETGLLLGAAINYEKAESGTPGGPEETDLRLTVDISADFDGGSLFAAFVYQDLDEANISPWGFVVQGGLFLNDDWEAFARYEFGDADAAGVEDLSVITVGVNRYWARQGLKWTTDVGFGLEEVADAWDKESAGWRVDGAGSDGQMVVRSQLRLTF